MYYIKILKEELDYYHNKFPDWDMDLISEVVEETLITAPIEFTYEYVQSRDYCSRCGKCCQRMSITEDGSVHACEHLQKDLDNPKLYVCDIWQERFPECREWPYVDSVNGRGIFLADDCDYVKRLIYEVLDNKFKLYTVDDNDIQTNLS